jgi:hypothetical protein
VLAQLPFRLRVLTMNTEEKFRRVQILRAFEAKFWEAVNAPAGDRSFDEDVCEEVREFRDELAKMKKEVFDS